MSVKTFNETNIYAECLALIPQNTNPDDYKLSIIEHIWKMISNIIEYPQNPQFNTLYCESKTLNGFMKMEMTLIRNIENPSSHISNLVVYVMDTKNTKPFHFLLKQMDYIDAIKYNYPHKLIIKSKKSYEFKMATRSHFKKYNSLLNEQINSSLQQNGIAECYYLVRKHNELVNQHNTCINTEHLYKVYAICVIFSKEKQVISWQQSLLGSSNRIRWVHASHIP